MDVEAVLNQGYQINIKATNYAGTNLSQSFQTTTTYTNMVGEAIAIDRNGKDKVELSVSFNGSTNGLKFQWVYWNGSEFVGLTGGTNSSYKFMQSRVQNDDRRVNIFQLKLLVCNEEDEGCVTLPKESSQFIYVLTYPENKDLIYNSGEAGISGLVIVRNETAAGGNATVDPGVELAGLVGEKINLYSRYINNNILYCEQAIHTLLDSEALASLEKIAKNNDIYWKRFSALQLLYYGILNRSPDAAGVNYYVYGEAKNISISQIANEFYRNARTEGVCDRIQLEDWIPPAGDNPTLGMMYTKLLNRPADKGGFEWWYGQFKAANGNSGQCMLRTQEFLSGREKGVNVYYSSTDFTKDANDAFFENLGWAVLNKSGYASFIKQRYLSNYDSSPSRLLGNDFDARNSFSLNATIYDIFTSPETKDRAIQNCQSF